MFIIRDWFAVLCLIAACSLSRDAGRGGLAAQTDAEKRATASSTVADAATSSFLTVVRDGSSPTTAPDRCDGRPEVTAELSRACFEGDVAAVRTMLATGTANDRADSCQFTPFSQALAPRIVEPGTPPGPQRARAERKLQIAHLLLDAGIDVNATDRLERTALHVAAGAYYSEAEVVQLVRRVLALKPLVNARTTGGVTPLWLAAEKGQAQVVALLLEAGADPSLGNARGVSPVEIARQRGYLDVERLLRAKLDPQKQSESHAGEARDASAL